MYQPDEKTSPTLAEELLALFGSGESTPPETEVVEEIEFASDIDRVVEALASGPAPARLPGAGVRLSKFTTKQMSRKRKIDKPPRKKPGKKHWKAKASRKMWAVKRDRAYNLKWLVHSKWGVFSYYKQEFGPKWKITKPEWEYIWDTYGLEGMAPVVRAVAPGVVMTPFTIVIRSRQESKLKDVIYDGQNRMIHEMLGTLVADDPEQLGTK